MEDGRCIRVLGDGELGSGGGHTSRIWDVTSSTSGDLIASASGDSTVKVNSLGCTMIRRTSPLYLRLLRTNTTEMGSCSSGTCEVRTNPHVQPL